MRLLEDAGVDFRWAIGLNRFCLDLIGIWPRYGKVRFRNIIIPIMLFWMIIVLFLPQMYALSMVLKHLPLVLDNIMTSCTILTSIVKLLLLWNNRQVLEPAIKTLMTDWNRPKLNWERKLMVKQAHRARLFTISGYGIMFFSFIVFVGFPLLGLKIRILNNITDPDDGRFFPIQTAYPYESSVSPYFELTYALQLVGGGLVGVSYSVPDNLFGALVFHASAQCEILSIKMNQLASTARHANTFRATSFRSELRRLVDTHVHLIGFVDIVEHSFNLLILTQTVCLTFIICCLGFGVIGTMKVGNKSIPVIQFITLVVSSLNLMIHLFVYCIASEILVKHSLSIFHNIYYSEWYSLPAKFSKDIIPIIVRSGFPLRLSAGKFFYLSLNAYLTILKSSAGFISMFLAIT